MARKPKGYWTETLGITPTEDPIEYQRRWRLANPGEFKTWKYGLTQAEFDQMLKDQDNRCAICRTDEPKGRHNKFQIDHCHDTGKVRGLLCWSCNAGLGQFKDSQEFLLEAHHYLRKNKDG